MRKALAIAVVCFTVLGFTLVTVAQADDDGPTIIYGTEGDDVIRGNRVGKGAQTVYGLGGEDRIWGGIGYDRVFGGPNDDILHNHHASGGLLVGGSGFDICVVGVPRNGDDDGHVTTRGCERVRYVPIRGHGNGDDD